MQRVFDYIPRHSQASIIAKPRAHSGTSFDAVGSCVGETDFIQYPEYVGFDCGQIVFAERPVLSAGLTRVHWFDMFGEGRASLCPSCFAAAGSSHHNDRPSPTPGLLPEFAAKTLTALDPGIRGK
jgi:hypothetical protein